MSYYPKSLPQFILVGLIFILFPLAFAFYNVASNLELLAGRGQRAVFEAVQITQDSRLLNQRITDMERVIKQYLVVEDAQLLEGYTKLHQEFLSATTKLNGMLDQTTGMVGDFRQGKGLLPRLFQDEDMAMQFASTVAKIDTIVSRVDSVLLGMAFDPEDAKQRPLEALSGGERGRFAERHRGCNNRHRFATPSAKHRKCR